MRYLKINYIIFLAILFLIPIICYTYVIAEDSVNFPFFDDYYAVLNFLNFYEKSNFLQRISLLLSQNNEHKITTTYLADIFLTDLFGAINLKHLIFVANLFLGGILLILYKAAGFKSNLIYFIPIVFIFFQPLFYELSLWPMASFSHIVCTFFALNFLYFINKQGLGNILIAFLSFFLAAFSNGNGIFVLPCALFILSYQKRYKHFFIGCISGLIAIYFYFFVNYTNVHHNDYGAAVRHIKDVLIFYFTLLGNCADVFSKEISLYLGIGLLGGFIYISLVNRYYKRNIIVFSASLFLFGTMLLISISRYVEGIGMAHRSLYTFYSTLLFILLYIAFIQTYILDSKNFAVKKKVFLSSAFISLSVLYWATSYINIYPSVLVNKYERIAELIDWRNKASILYLRHQNSGYVLNAHFQDILSTSINNNLYFPTVSSYVSSPVQNEGNYSCTDAKQAYNTVFAINRIDGDLSASSNFIRIMGKINQYTDSISTGDTYLILKSKSHCQIFTIYRSLHFSLLTYLNKLNGLIYNPYFFALISKKDLKHDIYQIGFLTIAGEQKVFSMTTSIIDNRSILEVGNYNSAPWYNTTPEISEDTLASKVIPINSEIHKDKLNIILSVDKSLVDTNDSVQPYIFLKSGDKNQYYSCISLTNNEINKHLYYSSIPLEDIEGVYENNILTHQIGLAITSNNKIKSNFVTNFNLTTPAPSIFSTVIDSLGPFKQTDSIRYNIDQFEKGLKQLSLSGWTLIQPKEVKIAKIYLSLFSDQDTLFLKTRQINRPDVYNAFEKELSGNFSYSGFSITIDVDKFKEGKSYKPALILEDQNKIKYLQVINQYQSEFKLGCSQAITLDIPPTATSGVNCYVDAFQPNGECIDMAGWCHIEGQGAENQKVFFVFKSDNNKQFIFPANSTSRFDVDNVFKERGSNLDLKLSGFQLSIPRRQLMGNSYKTGIIIKKDGETYLKWLDQSGYSNLKID